MNTARSAVAGAGVAGGTRERGHHVQAEADRSLFLRGADLDRHDTLQAFKLDLQLALTIGDRLENGTLATDASIGK